MFFSSFLFLPFSPTLFPYPGKAVDRCSLSLSLFGGGPGGGAKGDEDGDKKRRREKGEGKRNGNCIHRFHPFPWWIPLHPISPSCRFLLQGCLGGGRVSGGGGGRYLTLIGGMRWKGGRDRPGHPTYQLEMGEESSSPIQCSKKEFANGGENARLGATDT